MSTELPMAHCKRRLAALWFIVGGAIVLLVFILTLLGVYKQTSKAMWEWVLPTIMPTMSLMLGVLLMDMRSPATTAERVDSFVFWLSFVLSAVYLLAVLATAVKQSFWEFPSLKIELTSLRQSNLFLGPAQGLVAAAMGAFFVKGHAPQRPETT
ncbi:hypothetical protein GF420_13050 [candidate division GN15 bacterium]|nr:hypothetical protein [candidate division GN15 bacterium]